MVGIELSFERRLELITIITRVTRIPLLALFFVSVVEFILENARIDLELMTAALVILSWGHCGALECGARIAVYFGHSPPPPRRAARRSHAPPKTLVTRRRPESQWQMGKGACCRGAVGID
jgi:hypothetical protein